MENLFRIVALSDWQIAQQTKFVPRCAADEREGHIHLNELESVPYVTSVYFTAEENPIALEINLDGLQEKLAWRNPTIEKPWRQPILRIEQIPVDRIVAVHQLEPDAENGFKIV